MVLICRVMEKMGEGMRIHISSISKELLDMVAFKQIHQNTCYIYITKYTLPLLDQVGGFRCDYRGALDLGVTSCSSQNILSQSWIPKFTDKDLWFASCEGQPWSDGDLLADRTILGHWINLIYAFGFWLVQVHSVLYRTLWFYAVNFLV